MTTQDNDFQDRLHDLTFALIQKFDERLKENREHNELSELDDYRQWLT